MDNWNKLLASLDRTIGFANKIRSTVKKRWQGYDPSRNEHVIWLEYRIQVAPGAQQDALAPQGPASRQQESGSVEGEPLALIRELMDVKFVHTVDSSPSPPSRRSEERSTAKSTLVRRKPSRPKPPAWS